MYRDHQRSHMPGPVKFFFFALVAAIFVLAMAAVVMFLWNLILPDLLDVKEIRFWQAFGLLLLSRILFGGFPGGAKRKAGHFKRSREWKQRWMSMTEEERHEMRRKWKERCKRS